MPALASHSDMETVSQIGLAEPLIASVDTGATNTRIGIYSGEELLDLHRYATPHDYQVAIETIGSKALMLSGGQKLAAVGFAVAGKVDSKKIVGAGTLSEYGWVGKPFRDDVAQQFEIESGAVVLLNDCVAAANAQRVANRRSGYSSLGYTLAISSGVGGAGFLEEELIPDEPGHEFLKVGAICACGKEGCVEAHISGTGIARKFGTKPENLPEINWTEVISDAVQAHVDMIHRLSFGPENFYLFGGVTEGSRLLLPGLKRGLAARRDELPYAPDIKLATAGEDGGLIGAAYAALKVVIGK